MKKSIAFLLLMFSIFITSCKDKPIVPNEAMGNNSIYTSATVMDSSLLEIKPKIIDIGKVKTRNNNIVEVSAFLVNKGNKPIIIQKVEASCNCLSYELKKSYIPKGKSIKLTIRINNKNKKGYFNKAIFIRSNAKNKIDILRIKAHFEE